MYSIYDRTSAINEVLKYLGMTQNGIYSEVVRARVREQQRNAGLDESGVVDYATFVFLRELYEAVKIRDEANKRGVKSFPKSFGMNDSDVSVINAYISDVLPNYSLDLIAPRGSYYTRDTEAAVSGLLKIYNLPESVEADESFFVHLARDRDAFFFGE